MIFLVAKNTTLIPIYIPSGGGVGVIKRIIKPVFML